MNLFMIKSEIISFSSKVMNKVISKNWSGNWYKATIPYNDVEDNTLTFLIRGKTLEGNAKDIKLCGETNFTLNEESGKLVVGEIKALYTENYELKIVFSKGVLDPNSECNIPDGPTCPPETICATCATCPDGPTCPPETICATCPPETVCATCATCPYGPTSCTGPTCATSCTGPTCATSCTGPTCATSCTGPTCATSCTGPTCATSCTGPTCATFPCGENKVCICAPGYEVFNSQCVLSCATGFYRDDNGECIQDTSNTVNIYVDPQNSLGTDISSNPGLLEIVYNTGIDRLFEFRNFTLDPDTGYLKFSIVPPTGTLEFVLKISRYLV